MNNETVTPGMMVEAILMTSRHPLTLDEIASLLPVRTDVRAVLSGLAEDYEQRSLVLIETAGGWCLRTKPDASDLCRRILPRPLRLTKAAMETLAVIACFQPVTRSEIERVRGVSLAKGTMDMLIWAELVRPGPRRQTPGNPMTFLTTEKFLMQFDVRSLGELPGLEEMKDAGLLVDPQATGLPGPGEGVQDQAGG